MIKRSFQLEQEQWEWLRDFAYGARVSQSKVVRDALEGYRKAGGKTGIGKAEKFEVPDTWKQKYGGK